MESGLKGRRNRSQKRVAIERLFKSYGEGKWGGENGEKGGLAKRAGHALFS